MFEESVSTYRTFSSAPVTISLNRWIQSTMNPNGKYVAQVKRYRETGNKQLKKRLPCVTVSAVCENGHKQSDVVSRTGWIALDVDRKDNPKLEDAAILRDEIAKINFIAYAGLSVSGEGVWALVKVEDPQKQDLYFQQLQADFQHVGITLDSSKGANPNDLRFYSYDPNAYVASEVAVYDRLPMQQQPASSPQPQAEPQTPVREGLDTKAKVERLIAQIQDQRIDITAGYQNWRDLGFALESEFGEAGRDYFHQLSQFHPDYNRRDCNKQFTNCIKHAGSGIGIGTFFHVCRRQGITLTDADKPLESNSVEDPAPYGFNPWTEEVFDERGYPSDWDFTQPQKKAS